MKKPVLVILAAGMGSRYGGLKQMDPVDEQGHKIIDFSIYETKQAGFETVVFIIKKEMEQDFRECVGDPISKHMEVEYVFQDIKDVPEGFEIALSGDMSVYTLRVKGLQENVDAIDANGLESTISVADLMEEHGWETPVPGIYEVELQMELPQDITIVEPLRAYIEITEKVESEEIE